MYPLKTAEYLSEIKIFDTTPGTKQYSTDIQQTAANSAECIDILYFSYYL